MGRKNEELKPNGEELKTAEVEEKTTAEAKETGPEKEVGLDTVLARLDELERENREMRAEVKKTREKAEQETEREEMTEGRKQALMERKFHETMEKAKEDTVKLTLPLNPSGEDDDVFVCVNGYRYLIRRGEEVEVPRFVAEALKNSDNQKLAATRHMRKLQEKAKKE